jgi:hypothetical protein
MIGNPHALTLVSKGILLGDAVGMASSGYIVRITEYVFTRPPQPNIKDDTSKVDSSPGSARITKPEKQRKRVVVSLLVDGEVFEAQCIVDVDVKISLSNVEVIQGESGPVGIVIKNIQKNG